MEAFYGKIKINARRSRIKAKQYYPFPPYYLSGY
jgi:hypothetical protein